MRVIYALTAVLCAFLLGVSVGWHSWPPPTESLSYSDIIVMTLLAVCSVALGVFAALDREHTGE